MKISVGSIIPFLVGLWFFGAFLVPNCQAAARFSVDNQITSIRNADRDFRRKILSGTADVVQDGGLKNMNEIRRQPTLSDLLKRGQNQLIQLPAYADPRSLSQQEQDRTNQMIILKEFNVFLDFRFSLPSSKR